MESAPTLAQLVGAATVPVGALATAGLPIEETTYLAIGGGIGSFIWVDHLLIHGADRQRVVAIGPDKEPYRRCAIRCLHSQLTARDRLRSNSESCPDNLWGWPGYAVREIAQSLRHGKVTEAARAAWQIFGEPTLAETYTPYAGDVFQALDREAARIGWDTLWRAGMVHYLRKTDDGRYLAVYTPGPTFDPANVRLILAPYVHLAVGHSAVHLLPDLLQYRTATGDHHSAVNAYEYHEQVYTGLQERGGVVVIRGRGIVASRILQRLTELRQQQPLITIFHIMRAPLPQGPHFGRAERPVQDHWAYQPFNWPKACWGGALRTELEQADEATRTELLRTWGGTTTAPRPKWLHAVRDGLRDGWYRQGFGTLSALSRGEDARIIVTLGDPAPNAATQMIEADYLIDCTGLETNLTDHSLLNDLVEHHDLRQNPLGRLCITPSFELLGMEHGDSRMYAAGAMTAGGPFAAVDSFLGLQYAAMASIHSLIRNGAPGLRPLNVATSSRQWFKWATGAAP